MPPVTKMTPQEVAQDVEEKKLNMCEYKDPHAVKHPCINDFDRAGILITPKPEFDGAWKGDESDGQ